jgi:hypothetical protein
MGVGGKTAAGLMAVVMIVAVSVGCGSSGSGSSQASTSSNSGKTTASSKSKSNSKSESANKSAKSPETPKAAWSTRYLETSKGKTEVATFGKEASAEEREAASTVLEENLQARETGEWAKQCAALTEAPIEELEENGALRGFKGKNCADYLKFEAEPLSASKAARENTMTGPVESLRVSSTKAFAIYKSDKGKTYAIPMENIGGEWKVASVVTTEIP